MIGENGGKDETDLDETDLDETEDELLDDEVVADDDEMPDIGGDTVIDVSGEFEAIVEKLGRENPDEVAHKRAVRKRLEEIAEQRNADLDSTFNFDLDEDF